MSYSMTKFKVLSLNSFKNNLNIISFNKFKALSFFKLKSSLCVLLALFLSFSLTGCNWQGTSPAFSVSFYDENLTLLEKYDNLPNGHEIDFASNSTFYNISDWYLANSSTPVTSYILTSDISFYAVANTHEITDQYGLNDIRDDLGGKYILLNDIPLDDTKAGVDNVSGWNPIGNFTSYIVNSPFTGIFNGNGNTISNLWINRTSTDNIGLFGYTENAQIKNLTVEVAEGKEVKGRDSVGIIAGYVWNSTITNSYSTGNVSGSWYVGGIVGSVEHYCSVTNSYSTGNVSGTNNFVGGIAGFVAFSNVTNSYSAGTISGNDYVGGIAGRIDWSTVTNSYSTGSVNGYDFVGGIAGSVEHYCSVTNSYSTGNVSGTNNFVGGIAGSVQSFTITNSYSAGNVSGNDYIGGIAGYVIYSTIANSYSTGNVSGYYNVGGIAGYVYYSSTVTDNAAINPSVTGTSDVNRIAGYIYSSTVTNNFAFNDMSGSFTDNSNPANHGTSKTETNLKTQSTYSNAINGDGLGGLGWKFGNDANNPWKINAGKNNGYPYLYWE